MPLWSIPYHTEEYSKASFITSILNHNESLIIHDKFKTNELQNYVWQIMKNIYHIYPMFAVVKKTNGITIVMQAFARNAIPNAYLIYQKNKAYFNKFCTYFIISILPEIKASKPMYNNLSILNDKSYLEKLIMEEPLPSQSKLTKREIECLYWIRQGKTAEETAKFIHVSPETVRTHIKSVRLKLNTKTIAHTVADMIQLGYFT